MNRCDLRIHHPSWQVIVAGHAVLLENVANYSPAVRTNVVVFYFGREETVYPSHYYPLEMSGKISVTIRGS